MKKLIPILAGLILVMGLITGCGNDEMQKPQPDAEQSVQATQTPSSQPETQPSQEPQQNTSQTALIGEEKAKEIALSKAGISAEGVVFDRVELDNDDGVQRYEVEFRQGNIEYDVDIKADDGAVLKFEKNIE